MKKKILILGVTGQDGSYLMDFLIKKNYEVHGLIRKSATGNTKNIDHVINDSKLFNKSFFLHRGDLLDAVSLNNVIVKVQPAEIYNFADQDHVGWSYEIPTYSFRTTALSVIEILEILKNSKKKIKYFQPLSSNIFGITNSKKQNEETMVDPNSIYGLAKATAYQACKMYSRIYNLFLCGAIFYNHESPKRSKEYVTKKIVEDVCSIYHGKKKNIYLGDIKAKIDWGYAKDYAETAWKIMQLKKPDFFVIATGEVHSVEYFVKNCFSYVGLNYKKYLKIDKKLLRPSKTNVLKGDTRKAKRIFNYKTKTKLKDLIKIMMDHELKKYNG
jgi:GDPmannose 4,6-dehydratase